MCRQLTEVKRFGSGVQVRANSQKMPCLMWLWREYWLVPVFKFLL